MVGSPYIAGETVALHPVEEADLPFLRDTINDPEVRAYLGFRPPMNLAREEEYFESVVCGDDSQVQFVVRADGDPVGTVGLHGVDSPDGSSEIGLFFDADHWGQGYGSEAASLVVDFAFEELRRHRVTARVIEGNERSANLFESLGFRREATFREAEFRDGDYVDAYRYAVLADEWPGED
ncbi:MAG: GNAT family N-acetyltransferase [Halobacteriaceae archaeon]